MWQVLLTLIIIAVLFLANPPKNTSFKSDKKTQNQVEQKVNEVTQTVQYAREVQQREMEGQENE